MRAQLNESIVLRSTREIARHLEVSNGGTSNVSEPKSLSKTHLAERRSLESTALRPVYPDGSANAIDDA
jgi:hypothetical protein